MPKKTGHQRLWRCSWDCGFKSRGMREVFDHEEKEHDAIQYADWRKKKTLFVLFEMKFKQFKYSIEEIIGFLKNSKKT